MGVDITLSTRPQFLEVNNNVYTAWDLRRMLDAAPVGEGVLDYESFRVVARQVGGANLSVDVGKTSVGLMLAHIRGDNRGGQGLYTVDNVDRAQAGSSSYLAQLNELIASNASGNPRIDVIVLEVLDQQHAGASNLARVRAIAGTPTVGATLDNRSGAAAIPANALHLADVIVANGETTIDAVDIRDRRSFATAATIPTSVPTLETAVDMVGFIPAPGFVQEPNHTVTSSVDRVRLAALFHLPRRIEGATRIRWTYHQNATTAATGDYRLGIYDPSGRLLVETGLVAFTGATDSLQRRSEVIPATTLEPGPYYLAFIPDLTAGSFHVAGVIADVLTTSGIVGTPYPAVAFIGLDAGNALGTLMDNPEYRDLAVDSVTNFDAPPVPLFALSVG